jgi:hypothetical protein
VFCGLHAAPKVPGCVDVHRSDPAHGSAVKHRALPQDARPLCQGSTIIGLSLLRRP